MSWLVVAHEVEFNFECIFWIISHLFTKLGQLDIVMGSIFEKYILQELIDYVLNLVFF